MWKPERITLWSGDIPVIFQVSRFNHIFRKIKSKSESTLFCACLSMNVSLYSPHQSPLFVIHTIYWYTTHFAFLNELQCVELSYLWQYIYGLGVSSPTMESGCEESLSAETQSSKNNPNLIPISVWNKFHKWIQIGNKSVVQSQCRPLCRWQVFRLMLNSIMAC